MKFPSVTPCLLTVVLLGAAIGEAEARIKLITLPVRERVELQLDHPGATLVEEERLVPLKEGLNQVDFSWANTHIDPDSIVFRVLTAATPESARVLAVSYPPGEPALVWNVHATRAGAARIRISYLLGNLDRTFRYRAVASHDERTLTLSQHVRIRNLANEAFGESGIWLGYGDRLVKSLGIDETRDIRVRRYRQVPVDKTYTIDPVALGYLDPGEKKLRVAMHYVIHNDADHSLGAAPLPRGKARIFQDDGHGGVAFLGEDWGEFTAPGDEMALYLGVARDVVVRRTVQRSDRARVDGNLFAQRVTLKYEMENFKDQAVVLDVVEDLEKLRAELWGAAHGGLQWSLGPDTTFDGTDPEKTDAARVVVAATLPAAPSGGQARKVVHRLHLIFENEWQ